MHKDAKQSPQLQYAWTPTYSRSTKAEWLWITELPLKCQSRIRSPKESKQAFSSSKVSAYRDDGPADGLRENRYVSQSESQTTGQEHGLRACCGTRSNN